MLGWIHGAMQGWAPLGRELLLALLLVHTAALIWSVIGTTTPTRSASTIQDLGFCARCGARGGP